MDVNVKLTLYEMSFIMEGYGFFVKRLILVITVDMEKKSYASKWWERA